MINTRLAIPLGLLAVLADGSAWADFIPIVTPNVAYTTGTSLVPFTDPDNTVVSSTTDGTQTLSYSMPLTEYSVPATWFVWNSPPLVETSTPRVGNTFPASVLTINLSIPANTFGIEVEPDLFDSE